MLGINSIHFNDIGTVVYDIVQPILNDNEIRQLLVNTGTNPYDEVILPEKELAPEKKLLNSNILIVPKVPEMQDGIQSLFNYIIIRADDCVIENKNLSFRTISIRIDVICHMNNWLINSKALRPFAIMERIDSLINNKEIAGIGKMRFLRFDTLVTSATFGGYSLMYETYGSNV